MPQELLCCKGFRDAHNSLAPVGRATEAPSHSRDSWQPVFSSCSDLGQCKSRSALGWLIICVIKREFVQMVLLISTEILLALLMHSKQFRMLAPCESSTGAETKVAKPGQARTEQ